MVRNRSDGVKPSIVCANGRDRRFKVARFATIEQSSICSYQTMIFVLSPAKALDFKTPPSVTKYTQPEHLDAAEDLIEILRDLSPADIANLMKLSDPLATLNVARYQSWSLPFTPDNAKQAALTFNGDVYEGLDAPSMTEDELDWAQQHLRILSGLYGILRPLDLMQPYRLEMGTRLETPAGKSLYAWWGERLTEALNATIAERQEAGELPILVNLASMEYFKSVQPKKLKARVITPVFEDWKNGRYKIISFYAKRARGLMVRHAITQRLTDVKGLQSFDAEGYAFAAEASNEDRLVFRRR